MTGTKINLSENNISMKFNWSLMTLILLGKILPVFKYDKDKE